MLFIICSILVVFFFEARWLFKNKRKKEAAIYLVFSALAVFFGLYIMFFPDYTDFSKIMLGIFGIK